MTGGSLHDRPIRFAVVGLGAFGETYLACLHGLRGAANVEPAAVCSRTAARAEALAELDATLGRLGEANPALRVEREPPFVADWALDTPPDAPVVRAAGGACRELGLDGAPIGVAYGSDASKLWALGGGPSVVLGPGSIAQAHTADEYVPLAHLPLAAEVYTRTAIRLAALTGGA